MRRVPSPPPGNLDALLNTMTNALGILLILLAVTQLGVDEAVDHIEQRTEERSNTRVEKMVKDIADSQAAVVKQREQLQAAEATLTDNRKTLDANRKEISAINSELLEESNAGKVAEAQGRFDELNNTVKELEAKIAQATKETAELATRLDNAPPPAKAPAALVVSLPNPRPAAPNMRAVELVCHRGRVIPYNETALRKIAQERIGRAENELKAPDGINCGLLQALFEKEEIGNAFFRLKIVHDGKLPELIAIDRDDAGETAENIEDSSSLFQDMLRSVDRRNEWVRFRVFPDSFETYFAAREIAERRGLSVGWQPCETESQERLSLGLQAGLYCSGYKVPGAAPPKTEPPKVEPPKTEAPKVEAPKPATVAPEPTRTFGPNEPADPKDKPGDSDTKSARRKRAEETVRNRELRRALKDAQRKVKEKPIPPEAAPQSPPKEKPATTPPPSTEPAKPAAEPAKPAAPSVPNDDID